MFRQLDNIDPTPTEYDPLPVPLWIQIRAAQMRRERRMTLIEDVLAGAVIGIVAALVLIVLGWI